MSRDLEQYQQAYNDLPFESIQLSFRRRVVLEQIARESPAHLLEVGCGLRPLFTDVADFSTFTVVEPAAEFAAKARELSLQRKGVRVVEGVMEELTPSSPADMVIVSSLLHEVEQPRRLLAAIKKHCHGETLVHVNVPNAHSFHRLLAVEMGLMPDPFSLSATQQRMQQSSTFSLASLSTLLAEEGFQLESSGSYFVKPFTHAQMQQLCDQGMLTEAHLEGLFAMSRYLPELGSEIYVNAKLMSA